MDVANVGFNSIGPSAIEREIARQFISIPDKDLYLIARTQTDDKYKKINKRLQNATLLGIPIAKGLEVAISSDKKVLKLAKNQGIITFPMNTAEKVAKGLKAAGYIGAEIGGFIITNKIFNKLSEHVPFLNKFKEKSPGFYEATNLTVTLVGGEAIARGTAKVASKIANKQTVKNLNILQRIETAIHSIKKHIPQKVSHFTKAHSKGIKIASRVFLPIVILSSLVLNILKQQKETQANYQKAKNIQAQVAIDYAKYVELENTLKDVLLSLN